jgi:ABC-2 type transport system permease protein
MAYDGFYDVWYIFARALGKFLRSPARIFFQLFGTLMFLLLFTQLFSRFADLPGFPAGSYLELAVAGIVFLNTLNSTMQSANAMVDEINSGYLSNMLLTPVKRSAILLGRVLSDAVRFTLQTAIVLGIAYLMGATFASGPIGILLIFLTVGFFGTAWSGLALTIGLATKNNETVAALSSIVVFPLMFTSTALVPASFLPSWMQTVSNFNPLSYAAAAVRALMTTGFDWNAILPAYAVIALIMAATWAATLYEFRRIVT